MAGLGTVAGWEGFGEEVRCPKEGIDVDELAFGWNGDGDAPEPQNHVG
jgi:hypothetical protein